MTIDELEKIKTWFLTYAEQCMQCGSDCREQLEPRQEHALLVTEECRLLADALGWSADRVCTGEAIGLLHDAGRFSQYADFRTFVDSDSVDHCRCGYDVVKNAGILEPLAPIEQRIILNGIRYHNLKGVRSRSQLESLPYIHLIHDADRIDRFRITLVLIKEHTKERTLSVFSDGPVSQHVLKKISVSRPVSRKNIASTLDFYLFRLSSVFTIHYPQTFRRLLESGMFEEITRRLPDDRTVLEAVTVMRACLKKGATLKTLYQSM